VSFCDAKGDLLGAIRMARAPETKKATLKQMLVERSRRSCSRGELAYFRKHKKRMKYAELKAKGFMIGSGVVEAACKTLVTQRLKQSGMR
jgi:hypothetical protein